MVNNKWECQKMAKMGVKWVKGEWQGLGKPAGDRKQLAGGVNCGLEHMARLKNVWREAKICKELKMI